MALALEQICLEPGKSFRCLAWTNSISDVVQCRADGRREKLAGAGERWHFHPEYELVLITEGKGKRFVGDHVANFSAPDLVLIGSNLPHCWSELHDSSGYALQFNLDDDHPLGQLDEMRALKPLLHKAAFGIQFSGAVVGRVEKALKVIAGQSMLYRLAKFIEVLGEIAATSNENRTLLCGTALTLNMQDHHVAAISRAVGFILSNLEEEIHLEDLLKVTNMSKPTFCRHFKRHTGRPLTTFVNEVRIVNTKRLLAETNQSITDIAYDSGFRNLSHFNTQFRKVSNESPSDYRRRTDGTHD